MVYTAVIGFNERLQDIDFIPGETFDYICFTDNAELTSDSWRIVLVEPGLRGDPARSSRYLKLLGHPALKEYAEWLWIDNRVSLHEDPHFIFASLKPDTHLALALHDHRSSVADEFKAVIKFNKDHPFRVLEWYRRLAQLSPEILVQQPFAGTIILRRNCVEVDSMMRHWLDLVLRYSKRDQLTLNYALSQSACSVQLLPLQVSGSKWHTYSGGDQVGRSQEHREDTLSQELIASLWQVAIVWRLQRWIKAVRNTWRNSGN